MPVNYNYKFQLNYKYTFEVTLKHASLKGHTTTIIKKLKSWNIFKKSYQWNIFVNLGTILPKSTH